MRPIKIFKYIDELDCFVIHPEYKVIADQLGLNEWHQAVWIGRYFALDNDYGEHWFDNWAEREQLESKASAMGLSTYELLAIDPSRFKNNADGPCHTDEERKRFWTDVLKSLELSLETIFAEARKMNEEKEKSDEEYVGDLEERIEGVRRSR